MVKNLEGKLDGSEVYSKGEQKEAYTHEEAVKFSTKYFKGNDFLAKVFVNKYALKDSAGNFYEKDPDDMHKRLAKEIGRIESRYPNPMSEDQIYGLLKDFKYIIPQGGPMTGIGNDYQVVSLSNCFVIGNSEGSGDSYGAIMKIDQEQVQLMKRRGGVGHDLSQIRPKGSLVKNSALTSTGVLPFMERYSNSTREVAQDGRRGALMLSHSVKHPDVEDFIDAKLEKGKVTGANVSVKIDDEFMRAVESEKEYIQQYPIDSEKPTLEKKIDPTKLWKKIVHNAWKSAEPGILFWDTVKREAIPDVYGDDWKTVSTNPCGEIPLCPYDSCRLLAINLNSYVENPYTPNAKFNKELFKEHVNYAQRIMDDIIDLELEKIDELLEKVGNDPEEEEIKFVEKNLWKNIRQKAVEGRRTGIGITAEGDMLAALGLKYGHPDATDFSEEIHKTIAVESYRSSVEVVKEGRPKFEIYDAEKEKENPFINRIKEVDSQLYEEMTKYGRRNIALLTIAPTGTTSIMAQTTSGIEPSFNPAHTRRRKVNPNDQDVRVDFVDDVGDSWEEYPVFEPGFKRWMEANGMNPDNDYSEKELNELIKKSPYYQATSKDVDWVSKVKMQGRVQKWVDHSISVTVNLPSDADEELVGKVYMEAWKSGCKGITIYRDGSREGVLINRKEKEEKNKKIRKNLLDKLNKKKPEFVEGIEEEVETPYGYNAQVTLKWEKDKEGNLVDTYGASIRIGKAGDDMNAMANGFEEALSLVLKSGIDYRFISNQLIGIGRKTGDNEEKIYSLPDAIGKGMLASAQKQYTLLKANNKKNLFEESLRDDWFKKKISEKLSEKRPEYVGGLTEKVKTPYGKNAFIKLNWEKDEKGNLIEPYETFISIGKTGEDMNAMAEGLGRLISSGTKVGIPYEVFSERLIGIGGKTQIGLGPNTISSLSDAIGKGITQSAEKEMKISGKKKNNSSKKKNGNDSINFCPNCGALLIPKEGCATCSCGFSACG